MLCFSRSLLAVGVVGFLSVQPPRVIDAGTFVLIQAGPAPGRARRASDSLGTEEFTITQSSTPDRQYELTYTRRAEGRETTGTLTADSLGVPIAYRQFGHGGEASTSRRTGRRVGGRLVVDGMPRGGPPDYALGPRTLLFDEETVNQLYLFALVDTTRLVSYISVQRRGLIEERLVNLGQESVVIGRDTIRASHLVLEAPGPRRLEIWIDSRKRLLKVSSPVRQFTAIRNAPPG